MVSTGRLHGFESLKERLLLLALDFLRVRDVLSQPFELGFETVHGHERHTPDYLAVMPDGGIWLFDVHPAALIKDADAAEFAGVGLRPHVHSVLDALSSGRRPMKDMLGLQPELLVLAQPNQPTSNFVAARCAAVPPRSRQTALRTTCLARPAPGQRPADRPPVGPRCRSDAPGRRRPPHVTVRRGGRQPRHVRRRRTRQSHRRTSVLAVGRPDRRLRLTIAELRALLTRSAGEQVEQAGGGVVAEDELAVLAGFGGGPGAAGKESLLLLRKGGFDVVGTPRRVLKI